MSVAFNQYTVQELNLMPQLHMMMLFLLPPQYWCRGTFSIQLCKKSITVWCFWKELTNSCRGGWHLSSLCYKGPVKCESSAAAQHRWSYPLHLAAKLTQDAVITKILYCDTSVSLIHPLCPAACVSKRTWYDSFIIRLIISPFIHLSLHFHPPPLRCLIGAHCPVVHQAPCQIQQTDQAGHAPLHLKMNSQRSPQIKNDFPLVKHAAVISGPVRSQSSLHR